MSEKLKLVVIAIGVGLAAFLASLAGTESWDKRGLFAAIAAAVAAVVQYFTPLNETGMKWVKQ